MSETALVMALEKIRDHARAIVGGKHLAQEGAPHQEFSTPYKDLHIEWLADMAQEAIDKACCEKALEDRDAKERAQM